MALKRSQEEADLIPICIRSNSKRSRISPITDAHSDSSLPSTYSISEASALQSSDGACSEDTQQSSLASSSLDDNEDDNATSSPVPSESPSLSSSSEAETEDPIEEEEVTDDDEEEEQQQQQIPTIGGPKKPQIDNKRLREEADKLRRKLQEFMPKLRQANSELAAKGTALNMEDIGDDEQEHIEMNLGLGVLEEKRHDDDEVAEDENDDQQQRREEVLQTLMGIKGGEMMRQRKFGVQEVDGT